MLKSPSEWLVYCLSQISYKKNSHALDLACGYGRNSIYLEDRGYIVISIDISKKALDHFSGKNIRKFCKNIEDINKELELYSSELAQKEQWIILNKNDLDPSKEKIIKQEVKKKISKKEIFSISAITGKGVEKLVSKIGTKIFSLD